MIKKFIYNFTTKKFDKDLPKTKEDLKNLINTKKIYKIGCLREFNDQEKYLKKLKDSDYLEKFENKINLEILKNSYCLLENEYNYSRLLRNLPQVKHYCLWYYSLLDLKSFDFSKYLILQNPPSKQSIKTIKHLHLYV